jgi:hypothetical protein
MGKFKDLTGQRFGRLVAVERANNKGTRAAWVCQCDCGESSTVSGKDLRRGTKSCGCLQRDKASQYAKIDLTGHVFGKLTVINESDHDPGRVIWLCKCECGLNVNVSTGSLRSGNTLSCGCLRKQLVAKMNWKHGGSRTGRRERLNQIWQRMKQRCRDHNSSDYERYGGRGIRVCEEWKFDYSNFRSWALSHGYADNLTIDRIDNDGNYEPGNCRWISNSKQARNKSTNHPITYKDETKTLAEWSEITGLESSLIRYRLKIGWTIEDALALMPSNSHKGGSHEKHKAA